MRALLPAALAFLSAASASAADLEGDRDGPALEIVHGSQGFAVPLDALRSAVLEGDALELCLDRADAARLAILTRETLGSPVSVLFGGRRVAEQRFERPVLGGCLTVPALGNGALVEALDGPPRRRPLGEPDADERDPGEDDRGEDGDPGEGDPGERGE